MRVVEEDLKCVAFVCQTGNGEVTPVATAFLVLLQEQAINGPPRNSYYWITAGHVVHNITGDPILRINRRMGTPYEWQTCKAGWCYSDDSDVAAVPFDVSKEAFDALDVQWIDTRLFTTRDYKRPYLGDIAVNKPLDIGLGDEVVFFGLFAQHHGKDKNLPVVRFGNIARMPTDEMIRIEIDAAPTTRGIRAYLVEARSWGGQSGSPAMWSAEFTFKPKGQDARQEHKKRQRVSALLGVVSSHFDIDQKARSKGGKLEDITTKLNTGIAIVVPAHEVSELLATHPDLAAKRNQQNAPEKEHP